jgi:hypothetical protein
MDATIAFKERNRLEFVRRAFLSDFKKLQESDSEPYMKVNISVSADNPDKGLYAIDPVSMRVNEDFPDLVANVIQLEIDTLNDKLEKLGVEVE